MFRSSNPGWKLKRARGVVYSLSPLSGSISSQLLASVTSCMQKGVDSVVLKVWYVGPLHVQAVFKNVVGWLCAPWRKHMIALVLPDGWLSCDMEESHQIGVGIEQNDEIKKTGQM